MCETILICGEPAVGKSTILRKVKSNFTGRKKMKFGLVRGEVYDGGVCFVGVFDSSKFEGTDKLSMAVQPDFNQFIAEGTKMAGIKVVILEGDRLTSKGTLEVAKPTVICVEAKPEKKAERHAGRGDSQSEKFLKAKATKIENIKRLYDKVTVYQNNTEEELNFIVNEILLIIDRKLTNCST